SNRRARVALPALRIIAGITSRKIIYPRSSNRTYITCTLLTEGRHLEASWWRSRPEERGGDAPLILPGAILKRVACAVPAPGRHAGPGRPGAPPGGHKGSPARSWLIVGANAGWKAWPGMTRAAMERRKARPSFAGKASPARGKR